MARARKSITVRRGPSPQVAKLKNQLSARARTKAAERKQRTADFAAVAGGAAMGFIDRQNWKNPIDIPGVDDAAVYGPAAYFLADRFLSGRLREMVRGASVGVMACAARELVAGD